MWPCAGLSRRVRRSDGVSATARGVYAGKRTISRSACAAATAVAGYRLHKSGPDAIGSLLLGLHTDDGSLTSVGVIGAFPMAERKNLFVEMQPLATTLDGHPWNWAAMFEGVRNPRDYQGSRWNAGKDLSFVPLRPERVVEVRYDHLEGVGSGTPHSSSGGGPTAPPASCTRPVGSASPSTSTTSSPGFAAHT